MISEMISEITGAKEEGRRKSYVITECGRLCSMLSDRNGYFNQNLLYYSSREEEKENER